MNNEPVINHLTLARARRLQRAGMDLREVAATIQVPVALLDLALWQTIGQPRSSARD